MGIHTWNGYVNYEMKCLRSLHGNLKNFCFGCHTSQDVGSCSKCPVGLANDMFIDYLRGGTPFEIRQPKFDKEYVAKKVRHNKKLSIVLKVLRESPTEDRYLCSLFGFWCKSDKNRSRPVRIARFGRANKNAFQNAEKLILGTAVKMEKDWKKKYGVLP